MLKTDLETFNPPSDTVPRMSKRKGSLIKAWFLLPPWETGTPLLTTLSYAAVQNFSSNHILELANNKTMKDLHTYYLNVYPHFWHLQRLRS